MHSRPNHPTLKMLQNSFLVHYEEGPEVFQGACSVCHRRKAFDQARGVPHDVCGSASLILVNAAPTPCCLPRFPVSHALEPRPTSAIRGRGASVYEDGILPCRARLWYCLSLSKQPSRTLPGRTECLSLNVPKCLRAHAPSLLYLRAGTSTF